MRCETNMDKTYTDEHVRRMIRQWVGRGGPRSISGLARVARLDRVNLHQFLSGKHKTLRMATWGRIAKAMKAIDQQTRSE